MANDMMNRNTNDIANRMNDWFGFPKDLFDNSGLSGIMQADIAEDDKEYVVKIDMPGLEKDKIDLNYTDGTLTVSSSRKSFKDMSDKEQNIVHQERTEGHFSRSFRLPNVIADQIHAKYDNGVLTIDLPKQSASSNDNSIKID